MQITHVEVTPTKLDLRVPYRAATHPDEVEQIDVVFVRIETREGRVAWGCAAFDPALTGETLDQVLQACRACAERVKDLNPLNTEFALAELAPLTESMPSVRCAFDIAFYDLLGLAAGLPLHRLLGGYRYRIQTSITISLRPVKETVEMARNRARQGFRIIKLKGGIDGVEAGEEIYRQLRIPIVYLTAFSDKATLRRINQNKNGKPSTVIYKPFDEGELRVAINSTLDH